MLFTKRPKPLPTPDTALPGRPNSIPTAAEHYVFNRELKGAVPPGFEQAVFALGCFWGAERVFWQTAGVWLTAVGYAGGITPNPTYQECCSGQTGHTEGVQVTYDPRKVAYGDLLKLFWESHDPTQGMQQGNDVGTQYRSALYTLTEAQAAEAIASLASYQSALTAAGHRGTITTEVKPLETFYYAEDYHQQYLAKNPSGYCGIGGTGISCPIGAV